MKKIFAIFFAALMVLCFAACNKSDNNNSEGDSNISMSLEEIINAVYEKNPVELRLETTSILTWDLFANSTLRLCSTCAP